MPRMNASGGESRTFGKKEAFVYPNVFLIIVLTKIKQNQGSTK